MTTGSAPQTIGPYRILELLGEGGMGTVWLAEQREPVRRRVALKVIKLGMDTKAVLQRFELERQALAVMNHDHIARVFDAGTTERGQAWFAMEHVPGLPLTEYCDRHRLSIPDRLALFQQVCAGVQHAHTKGVIHRDLKPGNVLVTEEQGRAVPKIIDFGLARATDHMLLAQTLFTEHGQVIGTPEYMSPEQADPSAADIDTRTDIYSLGVVLYELLTGVLPFSRKELRQAGLAEMQRRIREVEPPRPSTRLSSLRGETSTAASTRRTTPRALLRTLRTDLDWIVLRALEKDRNRRYASPAEFAADLGRFLAHEPVLAGPPRAGYVLRKLARRHRGKLAAAAIVLVTAVAGAGVSVWFAIGEREKSAALARALEDYERMSAVARLDDLVRREVALHPPWPERITAMERWVLEADQVLGLRPSLEAAVERIAAHARPRTEDEARQDRESHPRRAEYEAKARFVDGLRRARTVREGGAPIPIPALPPELQTATAKELLDYARHRVVTSFQDRVVFGEEPLGYAAAEELLARVARGGEPVARHDALLFGAFAAVAIGLDREAIERIDAAAAAAPSELQTIFRQYPGQIRDMLADPEWTQRSERALAELAAELDRPSRLRFADDAHAFVHGALGDAARRFDDLEQRALPAVQDRLAWARRIAAISIDAHRAHWRRAREAIARADGASASTRYRSDPPIELEPQVGLVPIGMNPVTGLWEFYDLRSAWAAGVDPASIEIPEHDASGGIAMTENTGIVFVLLPGDWFRMGAQSADPAAPMFDADATGNEQVHLVRLDPFFLARHELTRGQWRRLAGQACGYLAIGWGPPRGDRIGWTNPAENVSREQCVDLLAKHGMVLPSEAQWEYACRAGSTTPWSCARDELVGCANLADQSAGLAEPDWPLEAWDDGQTCHAPVGRFRPNPFGLFDMHGNVAEWTRDYDQGRFIAPRAGDGVRGRSSTAQCVYRGGSFADLATIARAAARSFNSPETAGSSLGLRAARELSR